MRISGSKVTFWHAWRRQDSRERGRRGRQLGALMFAGALLATWMAASVHAQSSLEQMGHELVPGPDADSWANKYGTDPQENSWKDKYGSAGTDNSWKDKYGGDPDVPIGDNGQTTADAGGTPSAHSWPRKLQYQDYTGYLYPPQLESWDQDQNVLRGRAAVSIQSAQMATPLYGVVWLTAQTQVDTASGEVALTNIQVSRANFPSAPSGTDYQALMQAMLPSGAQTISLKRLQANLRVTQQLHRSRPQAVKNDPPRIIFSPARAMLIQVDGQPVLRPVAGTQLSRVFNTKALMLRDQSGTYFLYLVDRWLQAPALEGPWTVVDTPTADMDAAKQAAVKTQEVILGGGAGSDARMAIDFGTFPAVFVSTTPAALLQTQGPPTFETIEGTQLQFATNTYDNIFLDTSTQTYYALLSGRWYRTPSLKNGPWTFVSAKALPADFARIPTTHVAAAVLPSVAGTPQAKTSLVDNSMPHTATVKRQQAKLSVRYDGEPQFKPIEGTQLRYAVNSWVPVIASGNSYYACSDGVWFQSESPNGPWSVATEVPDAIYSIPPSSPMYHVTYVDIYGSTPDEVYVGYTPGYDGAVLSEDGVVVYGTGWSYTPWIGGYWIGPPVTYGLGATWEWSPVDGFGWGFAGDGYVLPWWGPVGWGWNTDAWNGRLWSAGAYDLYQHRWATAVAGTRSAQLADYRFSGWRSGLYAGADGRVYRRGAAGWEYHGGEGWHAGVGDEGLERDAMSRLSVNRMGAFGGGYRGGFGGGFRGGGRR